MNRLRVCLVAHHCNPEWGSEPLIGWRWASHLAEKVDLTVITHIRNRPAIEAQGLAANVEYVDTERIAAAVCRLNERLWGKSAPVNHLILEQVSQLAFDRAAVKVARRLVKSGQIELIHRVSPISPRFSTRLGTLGVPFVIGPVNGGVKTAQGFGEISEAEREGILKYRGLTRLLDPLARTYRSASVILTATEAARAALPRSVRERAIHFPENAVVLDRFPLVLDRDRSTLNVLYLGRLLEYKGVQYLLRALASVRKRGLDVRLDVVGDGPSRARLEALTEELQVRPWVSFHGRVPVESVPRAMSNADVFTLPSVRESGGAAVLEAMACGKPAIVVDHGGPSETVEDGCGIRLAAPNPDELVEQLSSSLWKLGTDEGYRLGMGLAARERVERHYTWDRRIAAATRIYGDLVRQRPVGVSQVRMA